MPLVRFQVRNEYGLGSEALYKEADNEEPKAVLEAVAVAGLVGILRQLGDLAEFAADVFHGLQEQVVTTASRSHKMLSRVRRIEAALLPLEEKVLAQKSHIHFAYTAGCEWHPKIRVKQKHFIHSDLPSFITDSYEECQDPPRLHLLDKFDTGGSGACLRRYSDPSFFRKVITRSEPTKAEKVRRQKRVHKSKKKSSRWRNGELSQVVSTSQCSGSRVQFGSPNSYGQSSISETISAINMRSRYEQADRSVSFDSRSRPTYIDCEFDGSSSVRQEDIEQNKLPTSSLKMQDSGTIDSVIRDEEMCSYANHTHESVQDLNSSSVTWDEKIEIVEPQNRSSGNIVGDEGLTLEFLHGSSDTVKQLNEAAIDREIVPEGIMTAKTDIPDPRSEDEMDEAGSETDKYADALNTLESETETDSECQTKQELEKPIAVIKSEQIDADTTHTVVQKSEMSNFELDTVPYSSSRKQMSPYDFNLVHSEVVWTQPPETINLPSDPDTSVNMDLPKDTGDLNVSIVDGCESYVDDPSSSLSSVSSSEPPLCDKSGSTSYVSQGSPLDVSEASSISVWTNGGLLGLAPSKPPDYSMSNGEPQNSMAVDADDLSPNIVFSESQHSGLMKNMDSFVKTPEQGENSSAFQVGQCSLPDAFITSDHHSVQSTTRTTNTLQAVSNVDSCVSSSVKKGDEILCEKPFGYLSNILDAGPGKYKDSPQSHNLSNADGSSSNETGAMTSRSVVPVVAGAQFASNDSSGKKNKDSFNMFGLGQKFLGNGYQRIGSMVHDDISGYAENGITGLKEHHHTYQTGKGKVVHHSLPVQEPKVHLENKSRLNSRSSSPPLDHMKISFHTTEGFEASKLRLKFPGGHCFHESIKNVIFPSFQLLPEPAVLFQEIDSDSDNDTFCRSSTNFSEDIISQYSRSSSEQWESDDAPGSEDHDIYHSLQRVSSSSLESMSGAFEMERISNSRFDNGLQCSEPNDGLEKLHYNALFDLPSFDTISILSTQQETQPVSAENNHKDSDLQHPKDCILPPPPLPPAEWRVTKSHVDLEDNDHVSAGKAAKCQNDLAFVESLQKHPHVNDVADLVLKSKLGELRSHSSREVGQAVHCKDTDEREDLLNQIRSKSFNLRPTVPTRATLPEAPMANDKVVAILEKANAIRQLAYEGSEETGDESWSDA